jgi:hypothetical protein
MNENHIKEIVENIIEAADGLLEKGRANLDPVEYGELLAYAESLCIIRDALSGKNLAAVGLDFDIDEKYLA